MKVLIKTKGVFGADDAVLLLYLGESLVGNIFNGRRKANLALQRSLDQVARPINVTRKRKVLVLYAF